MASDALAQAGKISSDILDVTEIPTILAHRRAQVRTT
jgi:hypothetical protein